MAATQMTAEIPVEYGTDTDYRHVLVEVEDTDDTATVVISDTDTVLALRLDVEDLDELIASLIRARDVVAANS